MLCIDKLGKQAKKANTLPMIWLTRTGIHVSCLHSLEFWAKHITEEKNWKLFLVPFKENKPFQGIPLLWVPLCDYFVLVLNPMGQHENCSWGFNVRHQKKQSKNYVQKPHMYVCWFSCGSKVKIRNRRGERKVKKREGKGKNSTAISIETKLKMFPNKRGRVFNGTLLLGDNVAFMVRFLSTEISNSCSMMSFQKMLLQ